MTSQVIRLLAWAAVAAVGGACGNDSGNPNGTRSGSADQAVSERPPLPAGCQATPPLRPGQVVLGCAELDGGRKLQARTLRDGPRRSGCLEIYGIGGGMSRACVHVPERRRPRPTRAILVGSVAQVAPGRPVEIYGTAAASVDRVIVHYRDGAGLNARLATMIAIDDEPALDAANLQEPFSVFVAELPADTVTATAVARDENGAGLGAAGFGPHLRTVDRTVLIYAPE